MKKIRLDVSALRVDSFEAGAKAAAGGTVLGYATKPVNTCGMTGATNCDCTLGCNTVPCTTS
jgi:hypothetical protein